MAELMIGSEESTFAVSLNLVKAEVANALDQAAAQLDVYSETGSPDQLRAFFAEVQQVRGTFKMLDFRAGERMCEEFAETGRSARGERLSDQTLTIFTQAIVFLKRFVDLLGAGYPLSPSLLVPSINQIRRERNDAPLPEAYFFLVNLRPRVVMPKLESGMMRFPYRRARQMYQLGLLGLMRGQGRRGPVLVMSRAISRFEKARRGGASWLFWHTVMGALDALSQQSFEMTPARLILLGQLDKQVRHVQDTEGKAFAEKQPDWLLKEFIHIVSLAQPDSDLIRVIQEEFQLGRGVKESQLVEFRSQLRGPDSAAMESLATALQEELQIIKDQIDLVERIDITEEDFDDLLSSLSRIGDTLMITNQTPPASRTLALVEQLRAAGSSGLKDNAASVADSIIRLEQDLRAISHSGLDTKALVDPISLREARIAVVSESMTALAMIKRAIGSYLESDGDHLHVKNVGKSLLDVAGALLFLDKRPAHDVLLALNTFITQQVLTAREPIAEHKMEAFADAITAIEYFLDTLNGQSAGADEAIRLAQESLVHLQS